MKSSTFSKLIILTLIFLTSCGKEKETIPFIDQLVGTYIGEMTELNCVSQTELLVVPNLVAEISKDSDTQINISLKSEQNGDLLDFKGIINSDTSFIIPEFFNSEIEQTYSGFGSLTDKLEIRMSYCEPPLNEFLNLTFIEN